MQSISTKDSSAPSARILNAVISEKIAHAYIFAGPAGSGRTTAAAFLAKALNCISDDIINRPCGKCAQCVKIDSGNHPDVSLVGPEKPGKEIGIDRVRHVASDIYMKAYEGRKKVFIIDCGSGLSREASNAFLKTLEEPPADSVLIMITRDARELLPTIVSRSQVIRFRNDKIPEPKNESALRRRSEVISALQAGDIYTLDLDKLSRQEARYCLDVMLTWYRDIMVLKSGFADRGSLLNPDQAGSLPQHIRAFGFERLDKMIERIIYTRACLDQDANVKLAMATLAAELAG